jgi:hypothetical protein
MAGHKRRLPYSAITSVLKLKRSLLDKQAAAQRTVKSAKLNSNRDQAIGRLSVINSTLESIEEIEDRASREEQRLCSIVHDFADLAAIHKAELNHVDQARGGGGP